MTVCVFDVNETLLDLSALDDEFERLFGDRGARAVWFQQLAPASRDRRGPGQLLGTYERYGSPRRPRPT